MTDEQLRETVMQLVRKANKEAARQPLDHRRAMAKYLAPEDDQ